MPNAHYRLELAACGNDLEAAQQCAQVLDGTLYIDPREKHAHLPFRALVTATTDDLEDLADAAGVGLYLVCRRVVKPGHPKFVGLFTMMHHPDLSHAQADGHWRDQHGPLALEHHPAMTNYSQLNVLQTLSGPEVDGFALCGFETEQDLRERFYATKESVGVIAADVKRFADVKRSPPRLVATVTEFAN